MDVEIDLGGFSVATRKQLAKEGLRILAERLGVRLDCFDGEDRAAINEIRELLTAARSVPATPEFLSLREAATITGLSYSHVRRAVLAGSLPASNVGTKAHSVYRVARTDLNAWLESKKGGTVKVPPRSELDDLIGRHLPGLRGLKDSATR